MQSVYQFVVHAEYQGYTVGEYLGHQLLSFSPATIKRMVHEQLVQVNQEVATHYTKLAVKDRIKIEIPPDKDYLQTPSFGPLDILFENKEFLVVNKPAGMPVVPERWIRQAAFKNAIAQYLADNGQAACEPRVVHRIDKEASGAVLVAKTREMERYLTRLFETRTIHKEYLAVVSGTPPRSGRIELKIMQGSSHSSRMVVSEFGKMAITTYEVVEYFRDFALLKVIIATGRTHQIRLHMSSQGYPLAIDPIYGYRQAIKLSELKPNYRPKKDTLEKPIISRLTLHAARISFTLPGSNETFTTEAPLPKDLQMLLKMLRKYRSQGPGAELPENAPLVAGMVTEANLAKLPEIHSDPSADLQEMVADDTGKWPDDDDFAE